MTAPLHDRDFGFSPLIGCAAVILLIFGVVAIALGGFLVFAQNDLANRKQALRENGMPVTLAELDAYYEPVPDDENAALVYLQAVDAFNGADLDARDHIPIVYSGPLPERGAPLEPEALEPSQRLLDQNEDTLALAHQAAKLIRARYPIDLTVGVDVDLGYLKTLRHLARLLALEANVNAQQGDTQAAVDALAAMAALARSLINEPILMSQLVRIAIVDMTVDHLARVVSLTPLQPEHLDALVNALVAASDPQALTRALIGECVFNLSAIPNANPVAKWRFAVDQRALMNRYDALIDASRLDPPEMHAAFEALHDPEPSALDRFISPLTHILMPALTRSHNAFLRERIHLDLVRSIAAIETFRLDTNQLPESLNALVPTYLDAVPTDPYTEQPILYKTRDLGYVVYSAGPNAIDEDAAEPEGLNGDIPLRIAR